MNYKNYKYYIVTNEDGRPMSFQEDQFVFAEDGRRRSPFPIELYTKKQADLFIKKTVVFRMKNNYEAGNYRLMPVSPKIKTKNL